MRLNYYYNFKNTIRFFMDIEQMDFSSIQINKRSWSSPFIFRIKKDDNSYRKLQIPNIYNFKLAYDYYKGELTNFGYDFERLEDLDYHKRMEIDYDLGEFKENSYNEWQLVDYNKLIDYELLIRCDIKSFYDNIYTHYIFDEITSDKEVDKPLSHMRLGRTAGIIMGNYISLYCAELLSKRISKRFEERITELKLNCDFSYFSDDFYIFTSKNDKDKVINLFDEVLEEFELEKNEDKIKYYDYLHYTCSDVIEKYWKKITRQCKSQQYSQNIKILNGKLKYNNNLFFTNQLIYRLNQLNEYREQRVFIVNFFKSEFYRNIDFSNTYFDEYNYHQLLYLIKRFPEIILYISNIFNSFDIFKSEDFISKVVRFYIESLSSNYHDEQLYFFYLIKRLNAVNSIKDSDINNKVLKSKNYLLIGYYIIDDIFDSNEIDIIKSYNDESYWLVYYYLILHDATLYSDLDNSIQHYLIPKEANKQSIKDAYLSFYKDNLISKNEILVPLSDVEKRLDLYFEEKFKKGKTTEENSN